MDITKIRKHIFLSATVLFFISCFLILFLEQIPPFYAKFIAYSSLLLLVVMMLSADGRNTPFFISSFVAAILAACLWIVLRGYSLTKWKALVYAIILYVITLLIMEFIKMIFGQVNLFTKTKREKSAGGNG